MNRENIIGIMLIAVAAALVALLNSDVGAMAAKCVGKAVWYLPYVAVVGAVRSFRKAAAGK